MDTWIQVIDNDVQLNIPILRQLGKTPNFCNQVTTLQLDNIFFVLFNKGLTLPEKVDIVATIGNIILVNRDLHTLYFIPKYSKRTFVYCNGLVKQMHGSSDQMLLPVFRILFLTLYGGVQEISDEVIDDVFQILYDGFKDCVGRLDTFETKLEYFTLLVTEVLKCLYTLHHKFHYGMNLIQDEKFTDDCMRIINFYASEPTSLVVKNSLNLLFVLFSERENNKAEELYDADFDVYHQFFKNLQLLLQVFLAKNFEDHASHDDTTFLVNLLVVLNHFAKSLAQGVHKNERYKNLFDDLVNHILPNDESSDLYNQMITLLKDSLISGGIQSMTHLQQAGLNKDLILEVFYNLTYDDDIVKHQTDFVVLVGVLNLHSFFQKRDIKVDERVNVKGYSHPTSKYLDTLIYGEVKEILNSGLEKSALDDMTEEEKEIEAEKLFVLFERMEKLGTFENFKNPVKQWQQEGKFEDIS